MALPNDVWSQIPTAILDLSTRTADAAAWATTQRAKVADLWGNIQKQAVSSMANAWQQGNDSVDHFAAGFQGTQAGVTRPSASPGYNDMAGASSSPTPAFGANPQDVTSPIDQARASGTGTQLLPGNQPLTDAATNIGTGIKNWAQENQDRQTAAFTPSTPRQPGDKLMSGFTPEQQTAQNSIAVNAIMGVQGIENEAAGLAGKAAAPLADAAKGAIGDVTRYYHGTGTTDSGVYPLASGIVDGLKVRSSTPNLDSIGASLGGTDYEVLRGIRDVPFSYFEQPASVTARTKGLAQQIQASGEINPLIVGIDDQGPYILEGANRYSALKINGAKSFPAVVVAEDSARPVPSLIQKAGDQAIGVPPAVGGHLLQSGQLGRLASEDVGAVGSIPKTVPGNVTSTRTGLGGLLDGATRAINEIVAPARNTAPEVQTILKDFANTHLENVVKAETMGKTAKKVLGPDDNLNAAHYFEATGGTVMQPTPEQAAHAQDIKQFMSDTQQQGKAHGYINGDVTKGPNAVGAYFPHIYEENLTRATAAAHKSGLNPQDFYSNARVHPTLADAQAAGLNPIDSFSGPLQHYAQRVGDSEAKYQVVESLKTTSPASAIPYTAGQRLPDGWVAGISTVPQFAAYAFPEPVARAINNIVTPSAWRGTAIGSAYMNLAGAGKQLLFTMSGFHNVTELRQAISANGLKGVPVIGEALKNGLVPGAWDNFRLRQAPLITAAARAGVTGLGGADKALDQGGAISGLGGLAVRSAAGAIAGGSSGYGIAKAAGKDNQTSIQYGLAGAGLGALAGPVMKPIADSLWERQVPTLKALTWNIQVSAGRDPEAAAAFVNNTYGGQNLAQIARSKTVQDTARFVFLAPDWWESWTNQLGDAFKGSDKGAMARQYWARTAVTSAFTLEGLNYALNHHFTDQNDPDHANQLEVTGLYKMMGADRRDPKTGAPLREYMSVLPSPIESILNLSGGQVTRFAMGRAGMVPRIFAQQASNKDYRGQPIVPPYTPTLESAKLRGANVLSQVSPIGVQQLESSSAGGEPASVAAFASATGLRTSPASKTTYRGPQISSAVMDTLTRAGVNWSPTPVGDTIDTFGLTRDERTQEQNIVDQESEKAITKLVAKPAWQKLPPIDKKQVLDEVIAGIHAAAQTTVLKSIPRSELKQRQAVTAGHQAAAAAP